MCALRCVCARVACVETCDVASHLVMAWVRFARGREECGCEAAHFVLLRFRVAVKRPARRVELLVEIRQERNLDRVVDRHVVLNSVEGPQHKVEDADGRSELGRSS